ncbi:MAG: polysaccharide biosynthesis/export family protein [Porphyromonadaceae bacterium]|nr:polysaccharide biosynthesis/export family protein [Porphyromonadaceae bacterium]
MIKPTTRFAATLLAITLLGVASCDSPKKFTYMQDVDYAKQYAVLHNSEVVISSGDRLSIHVGSAFPELAAPFNGGAFDGGGIPNLAGNASPNTQTSVEDVRGMQRLGYLVSNEGTINFPVLGKVVVAGKKLSEIRSLLEQMIIDSKYLTDPRVEVLLSNYRIYLLGAIAGQGKGQATSQGRSQQTSMFTPLSEVSGGILRIEAQDRVNILEAIAMTGDLPQNSRVDQIKVIRKEAIGYKTYSLDLRSVDIYQSPAFYLMPNDIVYVQPRYRNVETIDRAMQLSGYAFSTISSIAALVALIKLSK